MYTARRANQARRPRAHLTRGYPVVQTRQSDHAHAARISSMASAPPDLVHRLREHLAQPSPGDRNRDKDALSDRVVECQQRTLDAHVRAIPNEQPSYRSDRSTLGVSAGRRPIMRRESASSLDSQTRRACDSSRRERRAPVECAPLNESIIRRAHWPGGALSHRRRVEQHRNAIHAPHRHCTGPRAQARGGGSLRDAVPRAETWRAPIGDCVIVATGAPRATSRHAVPGSRAAACRHWGSASTRVSVPTPGLRGAACRRRRCAGDSRWDRR